MKQEKIDYDIDRDDSLSLYCSRKCFNELNKPTLKEIKIIRGKNKRK